MEILRAQRENLKKVAKLLKEGKAVVFPTDTLYGLIARADKEKSVKNVFDIKKRDYSSPVPVFVSSIEMAEEVAVVGKNKKFLEEVWPGQVTVVLKKKRGLPKKFFKDTVALRYPNYPMIHYLFEEINFPITGTSANISGEKPSGSFKKIIEELSGADAAFNGGTLPNSAPSSVLDVSEGDFSFIRKGRVSENELKEIYNRIVE